MPSIKELRGLCQNSPESPSWRTQSWEGKFNRIFSIYLTWFFIKTPITPNQITVLGVVAYLGGAFFFISGNIKMRVVGLLLMFISFVLDACDGEVARYKKISKGGGVGGAYVEPLSHDVMYGFFFLPIGIGEAAYSGFFLPLIAAFIATVAKLLFRLAEFRYDSLQRFLAEKDGRSIGWVQSKPAPSSFSYFIFRNFFTGTGIFFVLIAATFFGCVNYFLYFYSIAFFLLLCYKILRQWKKIYK